jgi:YbbR domain-containing protein
MNGLTRNLGWKLASVILAAVVWFAADYGMRRTAFQATDFAESGRRTLNNVPITIMAAANEPSQFIVQPSEVSLTLRGDKGLLEGLQPSDLTVYVNLVGITEARELRKKVDVHLPPGVTISMMVPADVLVRNAFSLIRTNSPALNSQ